MPSQAVALPSGRCDKNLVGVVAKEYRYCGSCLRGIRECGNGTLHGDHTSEKVAPVLHHTDKGLVLSVFMHQVFAETRSALWHRSGFSCGDPNYVAALAWCLPAAAALGRLRNAAGVRRNKLLCSHTNSVRSCLLASTLLGFLRIY